MTGRSRNTARLIVIASFNTLALAAVGPLVNPYLRDLGMPASFVGLYFAVVAAVQGLAAFAGGFLADALGRRLVWLIGKAGQLLGYAVLAAGVRGNWVLAAAVLVGSASIATGAKMSLEAEATDSRWRATFFAAVQTASTLVGAVAPLAGGLVADRYGARVAFGGILPLLVLAVILIATLEDRLVRPAAGTGGAAVGRQLSTLLAGVLRGPHPRTAKMTLALWPLNGMANALVMVGLPLLLRDRFGLGYAGLGALETALCIGSSATMLLGARFADRHGRRKIILASVSACAAVYWFVPALTAPLHFYLLMFVDGLVGNACAGAYVATAVECVAESSRATFSGVINGLNSLGVALGSLIAGLAYTVGPTVPVLAGAATFTLCALLAWLFLEETGGQRSRLRELSAAAAQDSA